MLEYSLHQRWVQKGIDDEFVPRGIVCKQSCTLPMANGQRRFEGQNIAMKYSPGVILLGGGVAVTQTERRV